ncbi:MAG: adenylate/guanylate cyclase domain-containing protein [Alphaproteobacteria bacterium]|nr:adenylate/guanylate cyclase domain-containing protein [Alphaproteobacteria bacterium]
MERRLAAILAADVVGYSKLMAEDEEATLAHLQAHRSDLFNPKVAEHRGRIIKLMGDGTLVEFASVVDAVKCAAAIQSSLAESDGSIRLRIGINIGDIIVEGDDIYGEGVNVAARLESLADAGGVCVSRNVYDQVKGKVAAEFEDLGLQKVKNIPDPVQVYRLAFDSRPPRPGTANGANAKSSARWPLAVGAAAVLVVIAGGAYWFSPWQPRLEPTVVANMAFPLPDKP